MAKTEPEAEAGAKKDSKKDSEILVPTRYTIPPQPMSRKDTKAYVAKLAKEL